MQWRHPSQARRAKSQSTQHNQSDQAAGRTLLAGKTLSLNASGAGAASNLTVTGSQLAGQDVVLKADNAITLQAASNTSEQRSKDSSASAAVGVAVSLGKQTGFGITASGSVSRGNADGTDSAQSRLVLPKSRTHRCVSFYIMHIVASRHASALALRAESQATLAKKPNVTTSPVRRKAFPSAVTSFVPIFGLSAYLPITALTSASSASSPAMAATSA